MAANIDWMPALEHMNQLLHQIEDPGATASMSAFLLQNWMIMVVMEDVRAAAKIAMEATSTWDDAPPIVAAQARMVLWVIGQIEAMG